MDIRVMQTLSRVEHRHGSEWKRMEETGPHSPADSDAERSWARGRIFRCTTCDDEIRVVMSGEVTPED